LINGFIRLATKEGITYVQGGTTQALEGQVCVHKNQASRTALKVAMMIVTLGAKPGMDSVLPPGVVEATENILIASGATDASAVRWSRSPLMACVYESFDWLLPGQFEAFGHRKVFFENAVRRGIDAGATQILILGAGYDTLGWRLAAEFSNLYFFEIDHPATACLKAKGIETMGRPDNLCLIAKDLGQRKLEDILQATPSWHDNALTVIIAEGLLMYLSSTAVKDLFRQCAQSSGDGSRIVFSFIPSGSDGKPDVGRWSGFMRWLQDIVGEPWTWSIRPGEELDLFLQESGWANARTPFRNTRKCGVEFYTIAVK
jgi:methyltransferase (TIGR00027 family)